MGVVRGSRYTDNELKGRQDEGFGLVLANSVLRRGQ